MRPSASSCAREISGFDYPYRVRYITGSVKITFYRTAGGANPVEKYLVDLDSKERAAVADALKGDRDFRPARSRGEDAADQGQAVGDQGVTTAGVLRRGDGSARWCCSTQRRRKARRLTGETWRPPSCGSERSRGRGPEGPTEATWQRRRILTSGAASTSSSESSARRIPSSGLSSIGYSSHER